MHMGPSALKDLAGQIDRMISAFEMENARQALSKIEIESVPKDLRASFAQLCRRAGINRLGLQFMHHLMHEQRSEATARDHIEYSSCLRRLGLIRQAHRTLERVIDQPQARLHQAFCYVHEWDYSSSCASLLKFLEGNPPARETLVAKVNLIAGLIFLNEWDTAEQWLDEVEKQCREDSKHMFLNCQEFRVQIHHHAGRLDEARRVLKEAWSSAGGQDGVTTLLLEKWRHIIALTAKDQDAEQSLRAFQAKVREAGHWESLRHLDWEMATALGDGELAKQVYFGTPFPAFRRMILSSQLAAAIPPQTLRSDARSNEGARVVDGLTGENMPFKFGSLPYRTLLLMCSDAYQPWTVYRIFDGMFGDENFDPFTSPNRVYQMVNRIKDEIEHDKIPLEVQSSGRGFRLRPLGGGALVLHDKMIFHSVEDMVLQLIKSRFGERVFGVKDLQNVTPLSPTQKARALRTLVADNSLEIISGSAKTHKYRVKAA